MKNRIGEVVAFVLGGVLCLGYWQFVREPPPPPGQVFTPEQIRQMEADLRAELAAQEARRR